MVITATGVLAIDFVNRSMQVGVPPVAATARDAVTRPENRGRDGLYATILDSPKAI
jgi:hypothetical protein